MPGRVARNLCASFGDTELSCQRRPRRRHRKARPPPEACMFMASHNVATLGPTSTQLRPKFGPDPPHRQAMGQCRPNAAESGPIGPNLAEFGRNLPKLAEFGPMLAALGRIRRACRCGGSHAHPGTRTPLLASDLGATPLCTNRARVPKHI